MDILFFFSSSPPTAKHHNTSLTTAERRRTGGRSELYATITAQCDPAPSRATYYRNRTQSSSSPHFPPLCKRLITRFSSQKADGVAVILTNIRYPSSPTPGRIAMNSSRNMTTICVKHGGMRWINSLYLCVSWSTTLPFEL